MARVSGRRLTLPYLGCILRHVGIINLPLSHGALEGEHWRRFGHDSPFPHRVVERLSRSLRVVELILPALVGAIGLRLLPGLDRLSVAEAFCIRKGGENAHE